MTQAAQQYAQALYELARDENIAKEMLSQLQALAEAFGEEADFLRLLAAPDLSKPERYALLDSAFRGKLHPYLLHFLKILTQEGLIRKFTDCSRHFQSCYDSDNGILPVRVYTAQPLTTQQTERLTGKMESITGKTVLLENKLDPTCLGGVRLCYDGKQIDGTVVSRLEAVRKLLKNTVL